MFTTKSLLNHTGMALISGVLLCACGSSNTQASSALNASLPSPAAPATMPSPDRFLNKDIAYADARKALLAQGWIPEKDANCKANMGADDAAKCDAMPELSIYSDQGVLMVHFRHRQKQLTVRSYGMFSDWKVSGEGSRLRITDWQISNASTKDSSTTP